MLYTHFTEKLLGLKGVIVKNIGSIINIGVTNRASRK